MCAHTAPLVGTTEYDPVIDRLTRGPDGEPWYMRTDYLGPQPFGFTGGEWGVGELVTFEWLNPWRDDALAIIAAHKVA